MIKICKDCWDSNKDTLKNLLKSYNDDDLDKISNLELVQFAVYTILCSEFSDFKAGIYKTQEIKLSTFGGTLLYIIPTTEHPAEYEYLITYINFGIHKDDDTDSFLYPYKDNMDRVEYLYNICEKIISRITKPYIAGWEVTEEFIELEMGGK